MRRECRCVDGFERASNFESCRLYGMCRSVLFPGIQWYQEPVPLMRVLARHDLRLSSPDRSRCLLGMDAWSWQCATPIVRRGRDLMDVEVLEVSLLFTIGERTLLRLEMDAWATVK